jgi:hypothetical protein
MLGVKVQCTPSQEVRVHSAIGLVGPLFDLLQGKTPVALCTRTSWEGVGKHEGNRRGR